MARGVIDKERDKKRLVYLLFAVSSSSSGNRLILDTRQPDISVAG